MLRVRLDPISVMIWLQIIGVSRKTSDLTLWKLVYILLVGGQVATLTLWRWVPPFYKDALVFLLC